MLSFLVMEKHFVSPTSCTCLKWQQSYSVEFTCDMLEEDVKHTRDYTQAYTSLSSCFSVCFSARDSRRRSADSSCCRVESMGGIWIQSSGHKLHRHRWTQQTLTKNKDQRRMWVLLQMFTLFTYVWNRYTVAPPCHNCLQTNNVFS